jgi:replication initiator protein RepSA
MTVPAAAFGLTGDGPEPRAPAGELLNFASGDDFTCWEAQLAATGNCANPVRLSGRIDAIDRGTGEIAPIYDTASEPGGVLRIPCGNRREDICPPCSDVYKGDARQIIRPWAADEARAFLAAAKPDPLHTAFVLLILYGLRRGEVLGLRWVTSTSTVERSRSASSYSGSAASCSSPRSRPRPGNGACRCLMRPPKRSNSRLSGRLSTASTWARPGQKPGSCSPRAPGGPSNRATSSDPSAHP